MLVAMEKNRTHENQSTVPVNGQFALMKVLGNQSSAGSRIKKIQYKQKVKNIIVTLIRIK